MNLSVLDGSVLLSKRAANEAERLQALAEYRVLGTRPEQCYDDITRIASITCGTPIALMSLVSDEKQWFKSTVGLEARETPRIGRFAPMRSQIPSR